MNHHLSKYSHLKLSVERTPLKYVLFNDIAELSSLLASTGKATNMICIFSTPGEHSAIVPEDFPVTNQKREEAGWRAIRIIGEMPFGTVQGLIATITSALKANDLGACVISTFLTDHFLIKETNLERSKAALIAEGWEFLP